MPPRSVVPLSCALVVCLAVGAMGAGHDAKWAVTDPAQVDEDFAFQGEYVGPLQRPGAGSEPQKTGLQVVARGDGQFEAMEFPGGLPGAGWDGIERLKLTGQRDGAAVKLTGWPLTITVQNDMATVVDSAGQTLGQLKKVHRVSPTMGYRPPPGGRMLFDGRDTAHFTNGRLADGRLLAEGADFKDRYRDFNLHLEFRLPYMPYARGQGRANSGVYLLSRYEVQILDSFGLEGIENECGALYRFKRPDLNMCFPPLSWQTYDIEFTAPRFDTAGKKVRNARITVWLNGVLVHRNLDLPNKTGGGAQESPEVLITKLQNHGNPVRFRNIWIRENNDSAPALTATAAPAATPAIPLPVATPVWPEAYMPPAVYALPAYAPAPVIRPYWEY